MFAICQIYVLINTTPLRQDSERAEARPPAARVSILYCQEAGCPVKKQFDKADPKNIINNPQFI